MNKSNLIGYVDISYSFDVVVSVKSELSEKLFNPRADSTLEIHVRYGDKKKNLYLLCTVHGVYCICKDESNHVLQEDGLCKRGCTKKEQDFKERKKEIRLYIEEEKNVLTVWL